MRTQTEQTVPLGELIQIVFDTAAKFCPDPREVSRLATNTGAHISRRRAQLGGPQRISRLCH